jgi:fructose-1,6-bisphosphatase/inositol monophosphatase family enzyme
MIVDLEETAKRIAEIAEEEIAARFGRLSAADIAAKTGPTDLVTEADHAAEARLKSALADLYPGAGFIGEEMASKDPSTLNLMAEKGAVWIVDPLDGTRNFVQKRKRFGAIVALIENGETRSGWIYAIPDKAFAMASKGDGATWRGRRLAPLAAPEGALKGYRAIGNMAEPWRSRLLPRLRGAYETEPVTCSAYGYIDMARGLYDFALYSRCWPWDHAAGVLMLEEIGGRAEYLDTGEAYRPWATQGRPLLVAPSADRWERVKRGLMSEV